MLHQDVWRVHPLMFKNFRSIKCWMTFLLLTLVGHVCELVQYLIVIWEIVCL
jgi:hypothetical protein